MKRWLPAPLLSFVLLLIWLLLNQSLALGHWLLGAALALAAPLLCRPLALSGSSLHKPFALLQLLVWAMLEIVRSCFNVSRIILFTRHDQLNSQFIQIPLDLRDQRGLALLSCLINSTPGTVWVEILPENNELSLHVFDLHDANWWVRTIKTRYEEPLIAIFESENTL